MIQMMEMRAYQDALDTLYTTESFFMNCSASGLSSWLDDQETQPFRSFSSDQQARNFMIGRFLPAAKAIASGSPQYASRKQAPVAQEEPRQVKEVVLVSRQRYSPLNGEGESEDEDENESDGSENYAITKVCGLFPQLCFLNPFPELRMETKSSNTQNRTRKEHARTSHREKKSVYSQFDPQRRGSKILSAFESAQCDFGCASPVVEKTLYIDSVHEVKSYSNSSSSAMKGQTNHHTWDPFETSIKDSGNCKKPTIAPRSSESLDLPFTYCPDISIDDIQMHITNDSNKIEHEIDLDKNLSISRLAGDVYVDLKSLLAAHSTDQECSKGVSNGKTDLENQEAINLRIPLSLPLPKAPSESWLKRTLPTISSSNVTAKIPAPSRIANNTATHDPKWERIVKPSKELLTTIPED